MAVEVMSINSLANVFVKAKVLVFMSTYQLLFVMFWCSAVSVAYVELTVG
mgnify:CR=1 FL=1